MSMITRERAKALLQGMAACDRGCVKYATGEECTCLDMAVQVLDAAVEQEREALAEKVQGMPFDATLDEIADTIRARGKELEKA